MKVTKKDARKLVERKIIERLLLKKSANQIAVELNTCKKTIKKLQKMAEQAGYLDGRKLPPFPEPLFLESGKNIFTPFPFSKGRGYFTPVIFSGFNILSKSSLDNIFFFSTRLYTFAPVSKASFAIAVLFS